MTARHPNTRGDLIAFIARACRHEGDACLEWPYSRRRGGYGHMSHRRKDGAWTTILVTRVIAGIFRMGTLGPRQIVMHSCDNPSCVNPRHLSVGDRSANARDMVAKGRNMPMAGEMNGASVLTAEQVISIRRDSAAGIYNYKELAKMHGVTSAAIHLIVKRKKWRHLP